MTYTFKRGDTEPALEATLSDRRGPAPLTGAEVRFLMVQQDVVPAKSVNGPAVVLDEAAGIVAYPWGPDDTDTAGVYLAEFEVTFAPGTPDERVETFPSDEYLDVVILPDLS